MKAVYKVMGAKTEGARHAERRVSVAPATFGNDINDIQNLDIKPSLPFNKCRRINIFIDQKNKKYEQELWKGVSIPADEAVKMSGATNQKGSKCGGLTRRQTVSSAGLACLHMLSESHFEVTAVFTETLFDSFN